MDVSIKKKKIYEIYEKLYRIKFTSFLGAKTESWIAWSNEPIYRIGPVEP